MSAKDAQISNVSYPEASWRERTRSWGMDSMRTVIRGPFRAPVWGPCTFAHAAVPALRYQLWACPEGWWAAQGQITEITHPSPAQRCCFLTPDSHCSDRQLMEPHKNAGLWLIVTFIPVALLGRSSALSLSFLPHVTALLLFKHGSVFNLISLFLFSFDKGKEIFSNRLKTRPLTQDQVQWAIRGNRILMANAKLWESQENKSHWRKNNLCFKSIKRKWDVEKSSGLKSHCKRGCDRAWAKSQGELGVKSQWAFCAGAEVWKCLHMYIIQCTMW